MLKWLMLCGSILLLTFTAAAQDLTASLNESSASSEPTAAPPAPAAPVSVHPQDREAWDLAVGYQYQRFDVFGLKFNNNGFHADVTRNFNSWLGLEGTVALGYGGTTTPLGLNAKSLFVGGGPHITGTGNRIVKPFFHALFGDQHFRFTQYGTYNGILIGSNNSFGFMGGGGFDFKFWPVLTLRLQADYLATHYQSKLYNGVSVGPSLVFAF